MFDGACEAIGVFKFAVLAQLSNTFVIYYKYCMSVF